MKKRTYLETMCLVIILTGVLVVSINATAQTQTQMTAFEKNLYQAALKEGKLEWWDAMKLSVASDTIKEFGNKYPGIKIDYFEATLDMREERYLAEYAAGRKTLDYTNINQYKRFKEKDLLLDISDIIKDTEYPRIFCDEDLTGVAVEHTIYGTAYNTKLVSPKDVPKSFEDLLDSKWRGKIDVEQRLKLFVFLTPGWGKEKIVKYLNRLKEQKPIFTNGTASTLTLLATGEFPIAVNVSLSETLVLKNKGAPVDFAPISPVADNMGTSVVMRHAPHPNAGKLFLRWLVTPEGQSLQDKYWYKGNPLPGSNTIPSKTLERLGIKEMIRFSGWGMAEELDELTKTYSEAVGFKKK